MSREQKCQCGVFSDGILQTLDRPYGIAKSVFFTDFHTRDQHKVSEVLLLFSWMLSLVAFVCFSSSEYDATKSNER
jgi:hypothetical protein